MKKIAIFIGVNRYDDARLSELSCAVADAYSLAGLFKRAGYETLTMDDPISSFVVDRLAHVCDSLADGDVLVVYFAGHGFQSGQRQLLLCRDARLSSLNSGGFTGALNLEELLGLTARPGVGRLMALDACRSALLSDTRDAGGTSTTIDPAGLDTLMTRDGATGRGHKNGGRPGGLSVVLSCAAREPALELRKLRRGLFSAALEKVLEGRLDAGEECRPDTSLQMAVELRMRELAREEGIEWTQLTEWKFTGPQPELLPGKREAKAPIPLPVQPKVKCPACGLRNDEDDTFECRLCGKDHLCMDHLERETRCCEDCTRMELERKTAAARAEQEQEAEAARVELEKRLREKEAVEVRAAEAEVATKQQTAEKQQREVEEIKRTQTAAASSKQAAFDSFKKKLAEDAQRDRAAASSKQAAFDSFKKKLVEDAQRDRGAAASAAVDSGKVRPDKVPVRFYIVFTAVTAAFFWGAFNTVNSDGWVNSVISVVLFGFGSMFLAIVAIIFWEERFK